ncbi:MAG: cytochrome c biogenesis protein CcsA [Kofleriaceae bacterium]|nr:cytochrome c biogenesis protein CcsA [Myxococcales bacterium]MCB9565224.1 cytochrome c biogenesis protein CcsA [Kofleriaceae bacterium]MCB9572413.1 cytochrome c biogenesis protein CcsA [Kofleriaceae bacterium]
MAPASPATSPIAIVGTVSLLVALIVAAWCIAAGIAGNVRKSRRLVLSAVYGLYGFFALVALASSLLIYAFVTHDYSIKYVAMTSDTSMSLAYKITAFWGGLDGSLLFWVMILATFSAVAVRINQHRHRDMIGFVVATIMVVQLFFLALLIYVKNPFAVTLTPPPVDGQGLNPLLQNYWMVIHPPSLYTGYVAATIPFAFGIGALASGRLDDLWLSSVRAWTLICFFFLSFGLILGGRWAYEELGWGGYWAWDPVENAGLFPWFTAVAFLHSAIIQEQRGMLKVWNLALVIITFLLTIFGTFMTRSGVVQSVHAFGKDDVLALTFILFMAFMAIVSFGLLVWRAPKLRAQNSFESFWSREFAFLLNNWILLGCAFFVLFATMFPTITEAFQSKRVSVGIPFFNKFMIPLGLLLLLLAGVAPLLAWRRTTRERLLRQFAVPLGVMALTIGLLAVVVPETRTLTSIFHDKLRLPMQLTCFGIIGFTLASIGQEYWQGLRVRMKQTGSDPVTSLIGMVLVKRRKYGGYIIHLGMAVMFVGFAGKAWDSMDDREMNEPTRVMLGKKALAAKGADVNLTPAEERKATFYVRGYTFVYRDLEQVSDDHKLATTAVVDLYSGTDKLTTMHPARWDFQKGEQPTTEVSIHPRLSEDVYVVLTGFDAETKSATFRIYINPLINWVWLGFVLLAMGTFVCLIPQSLVDLVSSRPKSRLGRVADAAALLLAVGLMTLGGVSAAHGDAPLPRDAHVVLAQADTATPPPGMEHNDGAGGARMGHDDGTGYAHLFRPEAMPDQASRDLARRLMKELVCMCGGCQRESLYDCKCGYAAQDRELVLSMLKSRDLSTPDGRDKAYREVVSGFVRKYGGEQVLATPRNQASWVLPYAAIAGGLALLVVLVRGWVVRGRAQAARDAGPGGPEDETYGEKLDDELRDID